MPYVTDTHSLVWHMTDDPKLSSKIKRIFEEDYIYIPCIVFFELLYLTEKKKLTIEFDSLVAMISTSKNYKVVPLCLPIIEKSRAISKGEVPDSFPVAR